MRDTIREILSDPAFLAVWLTLVAACLIVLVRDLRGPNSWIMPLMRAVWVLTVAYSGPFGLLIYWKTGRRQIPADSL